MRLLSPLTIASLAISWGCDALAFGGRPTSIIERHLDERALQSNVTWDEHSLFINGKRIMIFSGEIHPFRLPVPSLWIDVLQKVKALGLSAVSIYVHWALLEGKPGHFTSEGIFDYEPFFDAAKEVGLYVIARPGPYINAETSGGGFPGWLQRVKGTLRTTAPDYLDATENYVSNIGRIIANAQITNGGPVILYQPENEYIGPAPLDGPATGPDPDYFQYVIDQARRAGITVPLISNDPWTHGYNAPGTGKGAVDIYGHDGYPLGFDCAHPDVWPGEGLPTDWRAQHMANSPTTPYTIPEFQGGAFSNWGGQDFEQCYKLVNHEQTRIFFKNNYAAGVTIFNIYMLFGGTNWGNLGHADGYTSYDYSATIRENRSVDREKYSELKLQAQFLKVSPAYLTAAPGNSSVVGVYSNSTGVSITPLLNNGTGSFFVVRHANYTSTANTEYTLDLPTSAGNIHVPQLGGSLLLTRRDSKVHVTDYPVGNVTLLYSTAEILTWQVFESKTVLVVYGGPGELHEMAVKYSSNKWNVKGSDITAKRVNSTVIVQWQTTDTERSVQLGNLHVHIVDRNSAYNYWVPELGSSALIVKGPYLVRSADVTGDTLSIAADFNKTTSIEIIGVPSTVSTLVVNKDTVVHETTAQGDWKAEISFSAPDLVVPNLRGLKWGYIDSLPEIHPNYDDSPWPNADHTTTNNTYVQPFLTSVSLYGSDYGFNAGALLLRGHFKAHGNESELIISAQGGSAFGFTAWLNGTFLGSWKNVDSTLQNQENTQNFTLPNLVPGKPYVVTVLLDNMGLDGNWNVAQDRMKLARGILDYTFSSASGPISTNMAWKITGNLGGEDYADPIRGPLNEGGLYAERNGYHLPSPPLSTFASNRTPYDGLPTAGVAFYTAKLPLDYPSATWDIPLSVVFTNDTVAAGGAYRAWLYVNGFQFGRYISHIGPQKEFPVPEGILNYNGDNWIAVAVWAMEEQGAKVPDLRVKVGMPVLTGRRKVVLVDAPAWEKREGAY